MASFAALLGHAAGGFEQARQQDLQRQFEDEQNRRSQIMGFLGKIASDETANPFSRNAAIQEGLNVSQTPLQKKYKFDPDKLIAPAQPAQTTQAPGVSLPPPPPQSQQNAAVTFSPAPPQPAIGPPSPSGAPPTTNEGLPPVMNAGPPPPPAYMQGAGAGPVTLAAQPKGNIFMTPTERAAYGGAQAESASSGQVTGGIEARKAQYQQLPGFSALPPETQAVLIGGGSLLPLTRAISPEGQSVPGENFLNNPDTAAAAKAQGVQPGHYYNARQTMTGWQFAETAGKGETAATGGGLQTATQQHQQNVNVDYGTWQKKNATQFGQRQALLNQQFELGVKRGIYGDANKAFVDSVKDYGTANKTMQSMDEAYKSVQENPNNQQAQVALLMAHIGMTLGVVKGARVGKAQIEEAEDSRTMFAGAASKLNFDKDGNLDWSDPIRKGVTLTPDQMKQMVDLGHQRMGILHQNIGFMHDNLSPDTMQTPYITPPQMGNQGQGKKGSGPPKPPKSAPPSGNSVVDELIKKHG